MSYSDSTKLNNTLHKIIDQHDQAEWSDYLGKRYADNSKLVKLASNIYKKADLEQAQVYTLLDKTIQILSTRKLDENQAKKTESLKKKLKSSDKVCFIRGSNTTEVAGCLKKSIAKGKDGEKTIHIHAPRVKEQYDKWKKSKTSKDFGEYLEKKAPKKVKKMLERNEVTYLTEKQRERYLCTFKDGKVRQRGKTLGSGNYIFVLNLEGTKLYAGLKRPGHFHHTSFLAGAPVQCAGELHLKRGKIKKAPLSSGHYKPPKEAGKNLRTFLMKDENLGKAAKKVKILGHFEK